MSRKTRARHRGARKSQGISWAPQRRTVLACTASASAFMFVLSGVSIASSRVQTTLEVDGVSQPITVWGGTVQSVLEKADIEVGEHDLVQPSPSSPIPDGGAVVVRTARPYTVSVDGEEQQIWSTSSTADAVLADSATMGRSVSLATERSSENKENVPLVARERSVRVVADGETKTIEAQPKDDVKSILDKAGVDIGANDRVSLGNTRGGALTLSVARVRRSLVTSDVPLPFEEHQVESADLFVGESLITQEGSEGQAQRTEWVETRDGKTSSAATTAETLKTQPTVAVRSVGTKPVTPQALVMAGLDPKANLEEGKDSLGRPYAKYTGALGTRSSVAEIEEIINTLPDQASKVEAVAAAQRSGVRVSYIGQDPKEIAQIQVAARGWAPSEFQCLVNLWNRESQWNPYAENASSGAYGIPQSLPGSKMATAGADWRTNPETQITWGLGYIADRYGTPCSAWAHSNAVGWY